MSYAITGKNFIICCSDTEVTCPYCTRIDDGEKWAEALYKSKRGYIYKKCPGCKRKLFITSDMAGDLVVSEYFKV